MRTQPTNRLPLTLPLTHPRLPTHAHAHARNRYTGVACASAAAAQLAVGLSEGSEPAKKNTLKAAGAAWLAFAAMDAYNAHQGTTVRLRCWGRMPGWVSCGVLAGPTLVLQLSCAHDCMHASTPPAPHTHTHAHTRVALQTWPGPPPSHSPTRPPTSAASQRKDANYATAALNSVMGALCLWRGFSDD